VFVQGSEQKNIVSETAFPSTSGERSIRDLVIADPRVSRDHAQIMQEGQDFFLVDLGRQTRHVRQWRAHPGVRKLERGDRLEFWRARDSALQSCSILRMPRRIQRGEFLSQISGIQIKQEATDLEKLTLFSRGRPQVKYGRACWTRF